MSEGRKDFEVNKHFNIRLNLSQYNLTDDDIPTLITYLQDNPDIIQLNLSFNQISDDGAIKLASYKGLYSLNLQGNNIGLLGANAFSLNRKLRRLNLAGNNIPTEGVYNLLKNNTALISLELYGNSFNDKALEGIIENSSLRSLGLRGNKLTDESALSIAKNDVLEYVNLRGNFLTDDGAKALASNGRLKRIDVRNNDLSTQGKVIIKTHHPINRVRYAREVGLDQNLPSLFTLTSFFIKNNPSLKRQLKNDDLLNEGHVAKKIKFR